MIHVGYRHEGAPPGVNRVSYDALADPLAWAACAPGNAALLLASSTRVRSVWLTGDERADAQSVRCSCAFVTEVGVRGCVTYALMPVMEMNVWEDVHCRLSITDAVHMPPSHSGSDTLHSHDFTAPIAVSAPTAATHETRPLPAP